MRTLYLDCGMGAAGDMLAAALTELLPDPEKFVEELNALGIPDVDFREESAVKCGITGTRILVTNASELSRHHTNLQDIERIVQDRLTISEKVKKDILAVYRLIAEAESQVHGSPAAEISFHETDSLADIATVCLLMERLDPKQVIVSPVHVGSGQVRCAHGLLPVPAPATACLLKGVPIYGGSIQGELCTSVGAALLKHFATRFGDMPVMRTQAIGYGMGKQDFEAANCLRALLGETEEQESAVTELSCNVDDMTAEAIGFALESFFAAGALEAYTTPIGMKKSRPGTLICVMCREADRDAMIKLIFKHTTTLGVREQISRRYTLSRRIETVDTSFGPVRKKFSQGYGVERQKYEYEDVAAIARREGLSVSDVLARL